MKEKDKLKKNSDKKQFWITPPEIYKQLDDEFHFDFDPCPYPHKKGFNGVAVEWGKSNYVNPPFRKDDAKYGAGPTAFIRKAIEENKKGKTVVVMINTMSFINMLLEAGAEVRSMKRVRKLRGRIDAEKIGDITFKYGTGMNTAPCSQAIVTYLQ